MTFEHKAKGGEGATHVSEEHSKLSNRWRESLGQEARLARAERVSKIPGSETAAWLATRRTLDFDE